MVLKILCFAGSLCFLLFGMKLMSEGIQRNAGQKLQSALAFMTGNRFVGLFTGCFLTMIIQSSGATTVMLVSFVNAGLLTLEQSVGVIFGANIGTTVTAWIVALFGFNFKIEAFAIPIFGLGYFFTIVKKLKNYQGAGQALMGFGLVFIALGMLKDAFNFSDEHLVYFAKVQSFGTLSLCIAVFVGIIFTALIHSSSAMTAIVLTMASNRAVSWEFGAAMVIGSEIGSTIDSIMAVGTKANAKRTALIHVMFNVATVVVALILFRPFLAFIDFLVPGSIESNIIYHIAALHTCFKLMGTVLFIPFTRQIATATRKIIKDDKEEETYIYHLEFSEKTARETPETIVFNAQKEIADFTDVVVEMFDALQIGIKSIDENFVQKEFVTIEKLETYTDQMYEQLTHYLVRCSSLSISDQSLENVNLMIQICEELESMADGCLSIANQIKKAVEKEMPFRQEDLERLLPYFELSRQLLQFIYKNVSKIERLSKEQFDFAAGLENQIDEERKNLKKIARKRLESGADVKAELLYLDIIRQIEKLGDRCFDLADDLERR